MSASTVDDAIAAEVKADQADPSTTGSEDKAPDRSASKSSKRKASRRGKGGSSSSGKSGGRKSLQKPLEETLSLVGAGVAMLDPFDGTVILSRSEQLARALDDAAKSSPSLDRALRLLVEGTGWGAVAAAVASIAVPIGWRHGLVPDAPIVRTFVPPEALAIAETMRQEQPDADVPSGTSKLTDLFPPKPSADAPTGTG